MNANFKARDRDRNSCVHIAACNGHKDVVYELLKKNAIGINSCTHESKTPLYLACENGHVNVARELLLNGADFGIMAKDRNSCLQIAVENDHTEVVCELLKQDNIKIDLNNSNKETPLFLACKKGNITVVNELLRMNADFNAVNQNGNSCLHVAASKGHKEVVYVLLKKDIIHIDSYNDNKETSLYLACSIGNADIVKQLLVKEADINRQCRLGRSPVSAASTNGHVDVLCVLLENGATCINLGDTFNRTPLFLACRKGHFDVVKKLLEWGADLNKRDEVGNSPLHAALESNIYELTDRRNLHSETACELLRYDSIEIDLCNSYGQTPLHVACANNYTAVVQALVKKGANIKILPPL